MARMHSKKHGKSKSRKPLPELVPEKSIDKKQIEEIIVNYAKQGMEPSRIGLKLKEEHGIPYVKHYMGKRLVQILEEQGIKAPIPADLMDLMKKAVNMNAHIAKNKQDKNNTIRLRRIESKIWRLTKYYIRTGALPVGWRYDLKQAELLIKRSG
ncbi:MAG: 30S ribosomal protein S15 [Candidatus Micrarchaeaceae archaeon]|jgi:small subunit ribosomal protein S15